MLKPSLAPKSMILEAAGRAGQKATALGERAYLSWATARRRCREPVVPLALFHKPCTRSGAQTTGTYSATLRQSPECGSTRLKLDLGPPGHQGGTVTFTWILDLGSPAQNRFPQRRANTRQWATAPSQGHATSGKKASRHDCALICQARVDH